MSLTKKVAFNSAVQMGGRLIATLISFVSVKLLTTQLGPAGYGEYAAVLNYVSFFGVVADFGFFWILVRELAQSRDRKSSEHIIGNVLVFRSIFAAAVLACAVIAVYLAPVHSVSILTPAVKQGILVVAIATFWQTINSTFVAVFQANYRMERPVIAEIIGRIASLILLIPFLWMHLNVAWLVSAMAWGAVLNFFLNVYFAKVYVNVKPEYDIVYWRKILKGSSVLGIVSILALVYFKIDGLLLSILQTKIEVGIYAAPYKVIEILNVFPAVFMGVIFTAIIKNWEVDKDRAQFIINRAIEVMVVLALPVLVAGIILAGPIMRFISSGEYASVSTFTAHIGTSTLPITGIVVLQILLIAVTTDFFANVFGQSLVAIGKPHLLLWPNICAVIVNIGFNLYLIPRWSYAGAALVTVATESIVMIIQLIILRRFITVIFPWNTFIKTVMAVTLMGIVLQFFRDSNALIGIVTGGIVYGALAWKTQAISTDTLRLIFKKEA